MTKPTIISALLVLATAGAAEAGGQDGAIGVGAEVQINGTGGASLNYDAGKFHVGGFFGMRDPAGRDNTDYAIGGRLFYHVHSTAMSDFGVGGSIGVFSDGAALPNGQRTSNLYLEPSFQIRVFIAANVALSLTTGIVIGAVDAGDNLIIGGQVDGLAGVHYYFF